MLIMRSVVVFCLLNWLVLQVVSQNKDGVIPYFFPPDVEEALYDKIIILEENYGCSKVFIDLALGEAMNGIVSDTTYLTLSCADDFSPFTIDILENTNRRAIFDTMFVPVLLTEDFLYAKSPFADWGTMGNRPYRSFEKLSGYVDGFFYIIFDREGIIYIE